MNKAKVEYKSARSAKFAVLLETPTPELVELLVELEKHVRIMKQVYELTGDLDMRSATEAIKISRGIQDLYEPASG